MLRHRGLTAAVLVLLSLLVAFSANARDILQADGPDPTPPEGGQAVVKADLPVPERLQNLGTDTPPPSEGRRLLSDKSGRRDVIIKAHGKSRKKVKIPAHAVTHKTEGRRPRWVLSTAAPHTVASRSTHHAKNGTDARDLAILYNDDRTIYNDMSYPWGLVARVTNSAGGWGSGVLIGPRHVLTASHVINWANAWVSVDIGRYGDNVVATSTSRQIWSYVKVGAKVAYSDMDEDYAVITLNDALGNRFGFMGVKTYDSSWDDDAYWTNIGYPGDRYINDTSKKGLYPTIQGPKSLNEDALDFGAGRAMTTDADIYRGQSGSPMFGWWSGKPYVVAVVSSEGSVFLHGYQNWCAGGSELTTLVKYVRDHDL